MIKASHSKDGVTLKITGDSLPMLIVRPSAIYIVANNVMHLLPLHLQAQIQDAIPPEAFRLSDLSQSQKTGI